MNGISLWCSKIPVSNIIGSIGLDMLEQRRYVLMTGASLLSFVSCVLMIIATAASSANSNTIKATAWTLQIDTTDHSHPIQAYLGLAGYSDNQGSGLWTDCSENYCSSCNTAGENERNLAIIVFISSMILAISCAGRRENEDTLLLKLISIVSCLVCILCLIIAMAEWSIQCVQKLPTGTNVQYILGVGYNCAITSFCLVVVAGTASLLLRVIPKGQRAQDRTNPQTALSTPARNNPLVSNINSNQDV